MKKIQKYMMALLSLGVVAAGVVGCSDDDEYTLKSVSAKPSDKFNAKIQFVSRLTDAPLITSDADYQALKGYMVNTLNKREKSWLTVLDRTDNSRLSDVMQLSAFGGEEGVMNLLKRENMNLLMIGTVKNDLFGSLEQSVASADPSFKVYKVAAGSEYSVFMLAEERFWGFTGVDTESLGNGIEAYSINVMW